MTRTREKSGKKKKTAEENGTPEAEAPEPMPQAMAGEPGQDFVMPGELAQAVLNYLVSRPYVEVFQMVNGLANLQPVPNRAARRRAQKSR